MADSDLVNAPVAERDDRTMRLIRVLIAEDSPTIRYHLTQMIEETPGFTVIGQAHNGEEAVTMAVELRPDVISMDVRMPRMDGFEATRRIMAQAPTPVVIVSSLVEQDIELSFHALEAGALAVVEKPPDRQNPLFAEKYRQLTRTLSAMARVSVVRRGTTKPPSGKEVVEVKTVSNIPELLAVGASAGGPSALSRLLAVFPPDFPIPIAVVQHIPHEFIPGLARWLNKVTPLDVRVAEDGNAFEPGVVNLSPGTAHMRVARKDDKLVAVLDPEQGGYRYHPSVDVLFESVAETCSDRAIGLILTGMGNDGMEGLAKMKEAGARTFAQDRASSTVFGMPGAAIERGAVQKVLALADIPAAVMKLLE